MDFDSFGTEPWNAGGMPDYDVTVVNAAVVNGFDRSMRMNTENGLDTIKMTKTDSPRLALTPGEWYASDMLTLIRRDLRQVNGIPEVIGAMYDCRTVWGFPWIDSTAVD